MSNRDPCLVDFTYDRLLADAAFRSAQWDARVALHIAPINEYVDFIRAKEWAPYVAAIHGGVAARVLTILRDPGPATRDNLGSGFICVENDDPTAEKQGNFCRRRADGV